MKNFTFLFVAVLCALFGSAAFAQVTNLTVNDSTENFVLVSGSMLSFSYNIPKGDTALVEIWYDVNKNGQIDTSTDIPLVVSSQIDGDTAGMNGVQDMDGKVNGSVSFKIPAGVAPGKYILKATQNNQGETVTGTVKPLTNPAIKISGQVIVPSGKSPANIIVELNRSDNYSLHFWEGITDQNGNYTIEMNSDTAGNPWTMELVYNPYPFDLVTPKSYSVIVKGDSSSFNFVLKNPAAKVTGTLKTQDGRIIPNGYIGLGCLDTDFHSDAITDINGVFHFGLPDSALGNNYTWLLNASAGNSDTTGYFLEALSYITSIKNSDVIHADLVMYKADSYIKGKVQIDGRIPGHSFQVYASNQDSAEAVEYTNISNGNFVFPVSSKIYNYNIYVNQAGESYYEKNIIAHPGDDSVIINLSTSPLATKQSDNPIPKKFELDQNYPNPFNPATNIKYSLPRSGFVKLIVYNVLGEPVKTLVNREQNAGSYNIEFNADHLSSGIYFYQIKVGSYSAVKKMILLK